MSSSRIYTACAQTSLRHCQHIFDALVIALHRNLELILRSLSKTPAYSSASFFIFFSKSTPSDVIQIHATTRLSVSLWHRHLSLFTQMFYYLSPIMSYVICGYGATPIIGETVCECVSYLYRYRRESNEYRKIFKAPPKSFEEALRRKLYTVVPAQQGGVREVD